MITSAGEKTLWQECGLRPEDLMQWADIKYDENDIGAAPASGSWKNTGMIVVPCSMKTVAGITSGYSDNLILRAADVTIKEKRKLILVTRECPLSTIHLRNLHELSQMGVIILPPVVSYYNHPESISEVTGHIVGKIMDCMGMEYQHFKRWE